MSSHNKGRCSRISSGYASAAKIINSAIPLLRVFVASFAPFLIFINNKTYLRAEACYKRSSNSAFKLSSARGVARFIIRFRNIYKFNIYF